jgi:hypothetical protein
MSTCPLCQRDVVTAHLSADQTIVLEIGPATYAAVELGATFPAEGDRVFLTHALVEHAAVCGGRKEPHGEQG